MPIFDINGFVARPVQISVFRDPKTLAEPGIMITIATANHGTGLHVTECRTILQQP